MTIDYEDAVAVGGLSIRLLRPSVPEELFAVAADARGDAPYWAELWPCARSLAAHLATLDLTGMRVLELGCGLALPSLVAALRGADVLASDVSADALERVAESGRRTLGRPLATLQADLHDPATLLESGPFDLVLGADLLYDCTLAKAMGAEVIVYTTSTSKVEDAKRLGAHDVVLSKDEDQMQRYAGKLHFVLDAVSAQHDINVYLSLLRVDGSLALVGAPEHPLPVAAFSLIPYRRSFAGSMIGGIPETQEMLDFCGKHNIVSDIEMINIQQINEAYERLLKGDVKYRFVIDMASLKK